MGETTLQIQIDELKRRLGNLPKDEFEERFLGLERRVKSLEVKLGNLRKTAKEYLGG